MITLNNIETLVAINCLTPKEVNILQDKSVSLPNKFLKDLHQLCDECGLKKFCTLGNWKRKFKKTFEGSAGMGR